MISFALRGLSLSLVLLLAGCQSNPTDVFEQSLAEQRLDEARQQFAELEQAGKAPRLEHYRRQLAEAYLQQGQLALQRGDLDLAARALGQARSLLPQAPALARDPAEALDAARAAEQQRQPSGEGEHSGGCSPAQTLLIQ
ncbi:hypothetical protein [Pseudomonas sp. NCCP-436]|uniref:hypothetical protein n=1 Tax=Pseudomonas sp. NCCP-436 TaxID=2842481 RepID=UPI001C80A8D1|nr:hypothetical protein [Pseudomonas sp. NCCP-436]GIZ10626.1 hypothetical protein NCCP436_00420 [Pseudomonas sp. NCCP-436]